MMDFDEYLFFDDVYAKENELHNDIKDMWIRNDVHIDNMDERADQVLVGVQYRGNVVGVVTRVLYVTEDHEEINKKKMAYTRIFIGTEHRSFKLQIRLFWKGIDLIKSRGVLDGVIFDTENKKFERPGYTKRLIRKGFLKLPTQLDTVIWYQLF